LFEQGCPLIGGGDDDLLGGVDCGRRRHRRHAEQCGTAVREHLQQGRRPDFLRQAFGQLDERLRKTQRARRPLCHEDRMHR
jgi:hypothetical protein